MKISVIVPVYNCEQYIKECIESILQQTYKNLEIIIIDDGSTDLSGRICDSLAENDERITVIHQENQGVSKARNVGLELISGELVSFIDSDDKLELDMYEFLIKYFKKYSIDIVHCGYNRIEMGQKIPISGTGKIYFQTKEEALECIIKGELFVGSLWNKLYRRELLKEIRFDESLRINEDVLVNYRIFKKAEKSLFVDVPKYNYIIHNTSACNTVPNLLKSVDVIKVAQIIFDDCKGTNFEDKARERLLNMMIYRYRILGYVKNSENKQRKLRKKIRCIYRSGKNIKKSIKINIIFLYYLPHIYVLCYKINDKIRKANWDV